MPKTLIWISALALLTRLLFVPHPGFKADIAYWKWWGKASVEDGITSAYTKGNYPPIYMYLLHATSKLYSYLAPLENDYWHDNNYLYLLLIKLPYIASDIAIGWLIYKLVLQTGSSPKSATIASSLFLLNPASIYNSAIWGQTDSLSALAILTMYYFLITHRLTLYAIMIPINFFLKVQSLPFVLLSLVFLTRKFTLATLFRSLIPAIPTAFIINLPHLATNNFPRVISTMINSLGYFPYASLNAYNLHWLIISGQSDRYPDTTLIANFISHKSLGIILFALSLTTIIIYLARKTEDKNSSQTLYLCSLLTIFSSFMFMTEIHERYFFPILIFGALLTSFPRAFPIPLYLMLSASSLINLHLVMIQNYPDNNLSSLTSLNSLRIPISLAVSLLNLVAFIFISRPLLKLRTNQFIISLGICILSLIYLKSYLQPQRPVSLTTLTPLSIHQDWGQLTINKSVNGNLLAPHYYFHRTGLGTHANSRITYHLGQKYSRFTTGFGLDIEANDSGSVTFAILVDDNTVFSSKTLTKTDKPQYTDLDISRANTLTLIVSDNQDGNNGDHADWLEPTLYP